jgi:hypothetical protein
MMQRMTKTLAVTLLLFTTFTPTQAYDPNMRATPDYAYSWRRWPALAW